MNRLFEDMERIFLDDAEYSGLHELSLRYLTRDHDVPMLWHPLGFIDIPLVRDQRIKMVIHVWHPRFSRPESPPQTCHSHGWNLLSTVLAGSFENWLFDVQPSTRGNHQLYEVSYEDNTSVSRATGQCANADRTARSHLSSGQTYSIASDDFHWSHAGESVVVTIMYSRIADAAPARVAWPLGGGAEYRYIRQRCAPEDVRAIRSDVVAALRA